MVPADALPFVLAVWLGYRTAMPNEEYQAYLDSGTVHILSVSGLHMAMIYATSSFLISLYIRRPRLRAVLCMMAVAAFTLMSGMRASALRSAVMVFVYLIAELLDREPDAPTALGESALLLLVFDPEILFDGGFQLSFLCVASMLLFAGRVSQHLAFVPIFLRGNPGDLLGCPASSIASGHPLLSRPPDHGGPCQSHTGPHIHDRTLALPAGVCLRARALPASAALRARPGGNSWR